MNVRLPGAPALFAVLLLGGCSKRPASHPWVDPVTGMAFVLVRPGTFRMGLPAHGPPDLRAAPAHTVRIDTPFYLGRTEVTQAQWRSVMHTNPSHCADCGDDCPVERVSWIDVQEFLRRLNALEPGMGFRLPTEAEWEYACRAGTSTMYPQGDTLRPTDANFDGRIPFDGVRFDYFPGHPLPAGSFAANPWGLYDLEGNVWEWTADEYCPYAPGPLEDPRATCGTDTMVIRGGSWYFSANAARCGRRYVHAREDSGFSLGFRVARAGDTRTLSARSPAH